MEAIAGYQAVYLTDADDLTDVGDDPSFKSPFPTWGICRPDLRSRLEVGDSLFFVAYHRPSRKYYARGLLVVGELITHTDAASRFEGRHNVLLTKGEPGPNPEWKGTWKNKDLAVTPPPDFLVSAVDSTGAKWWHAAYDDHEIDNWKCRRIFLCKRPTLIRCLASGRCARERSINDPKHANYVVGDPDRSFVVKTKTPYSDVASSCGLLEEPTRRANQHPYDDLTESQVEKLQAWFASNGRPVSELEATRGDSTVGGCRGK